MFTGVTIKEFKNHFKTNEDCMSFLVDEKWKTGSSVPDADIQNLIKEVNGFINVAAAVVMMNQALQILYFIAVKSIF